MYVFLDGQYILEKEAAIPIQDRGFLFGDGVFTTIKVINSNPLYIDEHLAKLQEQMQLFNIEADLKSATIFDFIRRNKLVDARLKVIVTGGDAKELALPKRRGRIVIMSSPLTELPSKITVKPIQVPIFPGKLLSYVPRLFLKEMAKPCDDALLLSQEGEILGTAFGNVYWESEGELFTPDSAKLPLYWGVSIQALAQQKRLQRVCLKLCDLPDRAQLYRINSFGVCPACVQTQEQSCDPCLTKALPLIF